LVYIFPIRYETTTAMVFKETRMPVDTTGNRIFRTLKKRSILLRVRICDSLYSLSAADLGFRSGVIIYSVVLYPSSPKM